MTLGEFIAPLKDRTTKEKCLAVLYYKQHYDKAPSLTTQRIREALMTARVPKASKINVADVITRWGSFVDFDGAEDGRRSWKVTGAGVEYVRRLLNLPLEPREIEDEISTLRALAVQIRDEDARDYIDEAVKCLEAGALSAAIVFVWAGAMRSIQEKCVAAGLSALNNSLIRHDPKTRSVTKIDDFQYVKDKNVLLSAEDVGVVDKAERGTLGEALDLRNRCGHPNKYRPGIKKAASFFEDVIGIAFK